MHVNAFALLKSESPRLTLDDSARDVLGKNSDYIFTQHQPMGLSERFRDQFQGGRKIEFKPTTR